MVIRDRFSHLDIIPACDVRHPDGHATTAKTALTRIASRGYLKSTVNYTVLVR